MLEQVRLTDEMPTHTKKGTTMTRHYVVRPSVRLSLLACVGALLLSGCAMLQPPPIPSMPRFGLRQGSGDATCASDISRAHAALAAAGAAGGDPAATAAAHASAAASMHAYHTCLADHR